MRGRIPIVLGALLWALPALGQGESIDCLSIAEQQRFGKDLEELLKKEGMGDPTKVGRDVQIIMGQAMERRAKADECTETAGDKAPQQCKAEEAEAVAAEKRMEDFQARMEKFEQSMLAVRARYKKC